MNEPPDYFHRDSPPRVVLVADEAAETNYRPAGADMWKVLQLNVRSRLQVAVVAADTTRNLDGSFLATDPIYVPGIAIETRMPLNPDWGNLMLHGTNLLLPMVEIANRLLGTEDKVQGLKVVNFRAPVQTEVLLLAAFEPSTDTNDVVQAQFISAGGRKVFVSGKLTDRSIHGGSYSALRDRKKLVASAINKLGANESEFTFAEGIQLSEQEKSCDGFSYLIALDIVMRSLLELRRAKHLEALFLVTNRVSRMARFDPERLKANSKLHLAWQIKGRWNGFELIDFSFRFSGGDGEVAAGIITMARPTTAETGLAYLDNLANTSLVVTK